jgi:hypothetical protein
VSGYEASCPGCGAPIVFSLGASLLKVCEHCGVAAVRKGASIQSYGKVAELLPTPSVLALGLEGQYTGAPAFRLVGRVQLDHGAGTWDEWMMGFGDGSWAWLAEAQGRFYYMGQTALPPVPRFEELTPGETVDLGPPGTFVVTEVKEARFASGQGELPFAVEPGSALHYADLQGPGGAFATLDFGTGAQAEALYVGREVRLADMGFRDLPDEEARRKRVGGEGLTCPKCGGPLEIRAPDQTQRVGCPWCGSLLDATQDLAVLKALDEVKIKPAIPLGSKGRLAGVEWAVIGFMERSVTVEGIRYPWREYLLHEARQGFRWLVESRGHWSFVEPVHAGDVKGGAAAGGAEYRGESYKHFQGGRACVDTVLGEFYWAVTQGQTTETDDFVRPPRMLSRERDGGEVNWSLGTYTRGDEVWQAFGLKGKPPGPGGVAPNQPSPWSGQTRSLFSWALLFFGAAFLLYLGLLVTGGRQVVAEKLTVPQGIASGAPEAAAFVGPFETPRAANLELQVKAPVSNSWLYLDGALINEATGELTEFDVEVSYYYGRDSDGSWSEGGQSATRYLAAVPAGRYLLRLAPQWPGAKAPPYQVQLRSGVPRFYQLVLLGLALFAWPMLVGWRQFRFEMERWSESDHPWASSEEDE